MNDTTTTIPETLTIIPEVTVPQGAPELVQDLLERGEALQEEVDQWARDCFALFAPIELATCVMQIDLEELAEDAMPGWADLHAVCSRIAALADAAQANDNDMTTVPWLNRWLYTVLYPAQVVSTRVAGGRRAQVQRWLDQPGLCPECFMFSSGDEPCTHDWHQ